MTHPVLGVDHTYLLVDDLDGSAELYRSLGFTLSPRGLHSPQKGTANHTIIFTNDYLELLGIVRETDLNLPQRRALARDGEGLKAIANRTQSADAAKPALAKRGIATGEVSAFSRPLPLPGGGEAIASFRTLGFDPDIVPIGHFFLCQHEAPDLVWRPELQRHENGATAIAGIIGLHDNPSAAAATYAGFYANGRFSPAEAGFRVDTGDQSAPLQFVDQQAARTLFPEIEIGSALPNRLLALRIRVENIERTRKVLNANGVSFTNTPVGGIAVRQQDASGAIVEFVA